SRRLAQPSTARFIELEAGSIDAIWREHQPVGRNTEAAEVLLRSTTDEQQRRTRRIETSQHPITDCGLESAAVPCAVRGLRTKEDSSSRAPRLNERRPVIGRAVAKQKYRAVPGSPECAAEPMC